MCGWRARDLFLRESRAQDPGIGSQAPIDWPKRQGNGKRVARPRGQGTPVGKMRKRPPWKSAHRGSTDFADGKPVCGRDYARGRRVCSAVTRAAVRYVCAVGANKSPPIRFAANREGEYRVHDVYTRLLPQKDSNHASSNRFARRVLYMRVCLPTSLNTPHTGDGNFTRKHMRRLPLI